jgi:iron complex outermembrane receptor protein
MIGNIGSEKRFLRCLVVFLVLAGAAFGAEEQPQQDQPQEDLFEMGIEELMQMEIETTAASKTPVESTHAPGTVYVFSGETLRKKGILTIQDLLQRIPGIQLQPTTQEGMQVWFRGVQNRYNSNILLLVDGVPMRDYFFGHFHVDEMLPVENIDKIEVLLGPGGVVHGANAFAGVINITTKKKGNNEIEGRAGSFHTYGGSTHVSREKLSVFAKYLETHDGFVPRRGAKGDPRRFEMPANRELYIVDVKYDLLPNLMLHYTNTQYEYYAPYTRDKNRDLLQRDPWTASFNFTQGDLESLKLDAVGYYVDYDYDQDSWSVESSGPVTAKEAGYKNWSTKYGGFDAYLSKKIEKHTVLLGSSFIRHRGKSDIGEWEWDLTDPNIPMTKDGELIADRTRSYNDYAFYVQDQWVVGPKLNVTAGTRYDNPDDYNKQWSYRLGAVYDLDEQTYLKALFGTAFRVPTYREARNIKHDGTIRYDPDLVSERMKTFELAIGQKRKSGNSWLLTGFHNIYKDFITDSAPASLIPPGIGDDAYINLDKRVIRGVELSGDLWFLDKRLRFSPGAAYVDGKDRVLRDELHGLSKWLGYADMSYKVTQELSVGLNAVLVSRPHVDKSLYQTDLDSGPNRSLRDGYITLGANAIYKINKNTELQFIGRNIADHEYYSPHYPGQKYDYQWPGAEFVVQLRIRF